jgi:tetratricopeptide (TPR) repeat protein
MTAGPHPLVARGRAALQSGDLAATSAAAEERLRVHPNDTDALELRYLVHQQRGETDKAVHTLQAAIATEPPPDWAFNDLIPILFSAGHRSEAEQVARAALRANPRNAQANNLFGTILSELNDLPSGEWHFRRAIELAGPQLPFLQNLALNLMQQGRTDEAEPCFTQAAQLAPADLKTLAHWSKLYEVRGDLARASALLDRAQAISSAKDVNLLRAGYLSRAGKTADALAIIDQAGTLNGDGQLERGRLLDRLGRYDEAWRDFVEAKRKLAAEAGGATYQTQAVEEFFARLKKFFTRERMELLPRAPVREGMPQPVFIIGFPRSGTTLVEQILASHPQVRAGGELTFIGELRTVSQSLLPTAAAFPENLAEMFAADRRHVATLFRDHYFARVEEALNCRAAKEAAKEDPLSRPATEARAAGFRLFTDKMPFNEIWLPLLRMAFPHAKIIHIVRHPFDVCVSMMANHFTHGFNCGYRIEDIAHHLAAVHDLVESYRVALGMADFTLKYETLVSSQEAETRRLLDYLGLPFDEACLRFHESRRYAPTPSYAQVAQKMNDKSVDRHARYARHLLPFQSQMARILAAGGYGSIGAPGDAT